MYESFGMVKVDQYKHHTFEPRIMLYRPPS